MDEKSIIPDKHPKNKGTLYVGASDDKISALLEKSNALLFESLNHPKADLNSVDSIIQYTQDYFSFCQQHAIMPSFRRLANWFGYSYRTLYLHIEKQSPAGIYLDQVKDAIKDNLEQAALINAVNNISAMFILKSQYDYIETQKVVIEPSESLLGQPKSPEEIKNYIEADIVEKD